MQKNTFQRKFCDSTFKKNVIYAKKIPKMNISGLVVHAAADGVALGAAATTNQGARSTIKYYSSLFRVLGGGPTPMSHTWNAIPSFFYPISPNPLIHVFLPSFFYPISPNPLIHVFLPSFF